MTLAISMPRFQTVNGYLSWDHDRLDRILEDVARMVDDGELERAASHFEDFHEGLIRHIRLEEDLLFPVFEKRTGMYEGPTLVMRREHRLIRQSVDAMQNALASENGAAFTRARDGLTRVLSAHNRKEELVLYPMTDRVLDDRERAELVRKLTTS